MPATETPREPAAASSEAGGGGPRRLRKRSSAARTPRAHAWCDAATAGLLYFMVVFTPWAFGTTQPWSVAVMNVLAGAVGAVWLAKLWIRRREGYAPARWDEDAGAGARTATRLLAGFNLALLAYVLVSALNARATYDPSAREFTWFEPVRWLPHSYDRAETWKVFLQWLGFSAVFWAARDWLLTKSGSDRREGGAPALFDTDVDFRMPVRLKRLLWVLVVNTALVAVVGICQRLDGTNKLLWLLEPRFNKGAVEQFGPYAYRGNAAQLFNLVWPAALALWVLHQVARGGRDRQRARWDGPHLLLLPCAMITAAAPIVSSSRGGALLAMALAAASLGLLLFSRRTVSRGMRLLAVGSFAVAAGLGTWLGWEALQARFLQVDPRRELSVMAGPNDFTLLVRMEVPAEPPERFSWLFGISDSADNAFRPYSFMGALATNGLLQLRLVGTAFTNNVRQGVPNFVAGYGGRMLTLAAVRTTNLTLYVDGQAVAPGPEARSGQAPGWRGPVVSRWAWGFSPAVKELALLNRALGPEEIAAASQGALTNLSGSVRPPVRLPDSLSEVEIRAIADAGILGRSTTRAGRGDQRWIVLERLQGVGSLFVTRALDEEAGRFDGPARLRLTAINPAAETLYLAAGFDGTLGEPAALPPGVETNLVLFLRQPRLPVASTFTVAVVEDDGAVDELLPRDAAVWLSGMELQSYADVSVARLATGGEEVEFGDRLSGRPVIYRTAAKMAAEHRLWGSGAGSFAHLYQLYMPLGAEWAANAHNDWLELRITLGRAGSALLAGILVCVVWLACRGGGIAVPRLVSMLLALGLLSVMAHATVDFPFFIHSVAFTFVVLAAALTCLQPRRP